MKPRITTQENSELLMQVYCHPETPNSVLAELLEDAAMTLRENEAKPPCSEPVCKVLHFHRKEINHEIHS